MSKIWRALLISAVATGAAAVVLNLLGPERDALPSAPAGKEKPTEDTDTLTQEQEEMLLEELGSQL